MVSPGHGGFRNTKELLATRSDQGGIADLASGSHHSMEAGNSVTKPSRFGNASKDTRRPHLASVGSRGSATAGSSSSRCPPKSRSHVRTQSSKRNFSVAKSVYVTPRAASFQKSRSSNLDTVGAKGGVVYDDDLLCCYHKDGSHAGCDDKADDKDDGEVVFLSESAAVDTPETLLSPESNMKRSSISVSSDSNSNSSPAKKKRRISKFPKAKHRFAKNEPTFSRHCLFVMLLCERFRVRQDESTKSSPHTDFSYYAEKNVVEMKKQFNQLSWYGRAGLAKYVCKLKPQDLCKYFVSFFISDFLSLDHKLIFFCAHCFIRS